MIDIYSTATIPHCRASLNGMIGSNERRRSYQNCRPAADTVLQGDPPRPKICKFLTTANADLTVLWAQKAQNRVVYGQTEFNLPVNKSIS